MYIAGGQVEECVGDIGTSIDIEAAVSLVLIAVKHGTLGLHLLHVYVALVAQAHGGAQAEPEGGAAGPGGEGCGWVGTPEPHLSAGGGQVEVAVQHQAQPA